MLGTRQMEQTLKKYEAKAKEYLKRPEKTDSLIKDANRKAETNKGTLAEIWDNLQLLMQMVSAWRKGEYKKIPTASLLAMIASIIYFVSPIDLIPDFLVGLGIVDDAAIIGFVLKQIHSDLENFRVWKESSQAETHHSSGLNLN